MPLGLFAAQQTAAILTSEIISRLRLIFLFYKTLHFPLDPGRRRASFGGSRQLEARISWSKICAVADWSPELVTGVGHLEPEQMSAQTMDGFETRLYSHLFGL